MAGEQDARYSTAKVALPEVPVPEKQRPGSNIPPVQCQEVSESGLIHGKIFRVATGNSRLLRYRPTLKTRVKQSNLTMAENLDNTALTLLKNNKAEKTDLASHFSNKS